MKIGIDISPIAYKGTGSARFADGLIRAICKYDRRNKWTFLFYSLRLNINQDIEDLIRSSGHKLIKLKVPQSFMTLMWHDLHRFSIEKLTGALDWFITLDWIEAPTKKLKKATIVHDLAYIRFPELVDEGIRKQQEKRLSLIQKESKLIVTDSLSTQKDLEELLKIPASKIKVIYPGVEVPKVNKKSIPLTLKKFRIKKKFILSVGKIEPRKNIQRLIEAFSQLKNNGLELVVVGAPGWGTKLKPQKNVRLLGFVTDQELSDLYNASLFFAYPSIWEGFGYPVVEAMQYGVPVTTSDSSSLKEIAQDSALLFNPKKISEIRNALQELISSPKKRQELSHKGKKRGSFFSWENYYQNLINVLNKN